MLIVFTILHTCFPAVIWICRPSVSSYMGSYMLSFNWKIFFMYSVCAMTGLSFLQHPYWLAWLSLNSFHYLITRHFFLCSYWLCDLFLLLQEHFWRVLKNWRRFEQVWSILCRRTDTFPGTLHFMSRVCCSSCSTGSMCVFAYQL